MSNTRRGFLGQMAAGVALLTGYKADGTPKAEAKEPELDLPFCIAGSGVVPVSGLGYGLQVLSGSGTYYLGE